MSDFHLFFSQHVETYSIFFTEVAVFYQPCWWKIQLGSDGIEDDFGFRQTVHSMNRFGFWNHLIEMHGLKTRSSGRQYSRFVAEKKWVKKRQLSLRTFLRTFTWQLWEEYALAQTWKGNRAANCRSVCVFQQNASSRKKHCAGPTNEQWIQNVFERLRQHSIEEGFATGSNCTWEVSAMKFSNSSGRNFSSGSH